MKHSFLSFWLVQNPFSRHLKSSISILIFFIMLIPFSSYADINDDLRNAALIGDVAKIKELLYKGADVNAKANDGWTALMWAALQGHTEAAEILRQAMGKNRQ